MVNVVEHVEAVPAPGRWLRVPLAVLGTVVLVAGILALSPAMLVAGAFVLGMASGSDPELGEAEPWLWAAASLVGGYVLVRLGVRMVRGRRYSVLFLRRFGFTDATRALTTAVGRGLGRRWRLVTLDDMQVAPLGVGGRSRWVFRVAPWILVAVVAFGLLSWGPDTVDDAMEQGVSDSVDQCIDDAEERGENPIGSALGCTLGVGLVVGVVVGVITLLVVLIPIALAGSVLLFTLGGSRAIRRAERRRSLDVRAARQIDRVARSIGRAARRIYSPRLTVVRSAHDVWQQVVQRLASDADAIVVDVSDVSAGLLWEVQTLGPVVRDRWVLVGRRDRLAELEVGTTPDVTRLRDLLAGQPVLAYDPARLREFERDLLDSLRRVVA